MDIRIAHLSSLVGSPLVDSHGERLGTVDDLIVRLDAEYPPITGLKARIGGREVFVPADRIALLEPGRVQLAGEKLHLGKFERREGEILLAQDLLGGRLINLVSARLASASDVELAQVDGWWRVVGADLSRRGALRRFLPRRVGGPADPREIVDWSSLAPFVGHVPSARLSIPHEKLSRLHPAQIADLVEAASHDEGEEIIEAVGQDAELEADVFEELDTAHQVEFVEERSDQETAELLSSMAADDAADLVAELDQDRRETILRLLPIASQQKVRMLLGFNPATAGGLMSPDFLCLGEQTTVDAARAPIGESQLPEEALANVFTHDADGVLTGVVSAAALLRADPGVALADLARRRPAGLPPEADLPEVARLLTDFNLTAVAVVDEDGRMIGIVTVDDVLEVIIPDDWKRRFLAEAE